MSRLLTTAIVSTAIATTGLASLPTAQAGDWRGHGYHDNDDDDLVVAGILGLAVGALAASAAVGGPYYGGGYPAYPAYRAYPPYPAYRTVPRYNGYYNGYYRNGYYGYATRPADRYATRPAPRYASLRPWTPAWYRYCESRYRSFRPDTGTFTGYDGRQHFCRPR